MDDVHQYCNLCDITGDALSAKCKEFIENRDFAGAFHCAEHHVKLHHGGIDLSKADFIHDKLGTVFHKINSIGADIVSGYCDEIVKVAEEQVTDEQMSVLTSTLSAFYIHSHPHVTMGAIYTAALGMYVASGGEKCLWSMVDPDLCKEHS